MQLIEKSPQGFVLPATVFSLVILSTLVLAALYAATNEQRSSSAVLWHTQAYYVAEAGLQSTYANWPAAAATLAPGDSLDLGWTGTVPRNSSYRVVIHRTDPGTGLLKWFTISSQGRSPVSGAGGSSRLRIFARDVPLRFRTPGAVAGDGDWAEFENDVLASGIDQDPTAWDDLCNGPLSDVPGLSWPDTMNVTTENAADVQGDPPLIEDPGVDLFDMYDELAANADITFPANHKIETDLSPVVSGGACNTSVNTNWGAPTDPSHVCFSHFPIIHAQGDLKLEGDNLPSQGILLVDGDLKIEDHLDFYGVVMIKGDGGDITLKGENYLNVYGAVVVGGNLKLEDNTSVRYSSCVLQRVGLATGLGRNVERAAFMEMF